MKSTKKIDTLIEDIYSILQNGVDVSSIESKKSLHRFSENLHYSLLKQLKPEDGERKKNLRMSQIGKPDRQLWYDLRSDAEPEKLNGQTKLKFIMGDILEALLILLTEMSGHTVSDSQKELEIEGVKGHQDCVIDGVLVDIKSASPYAFKKFKEGTLHTNDPFGYIAQISGYAEANKKDNAAFFAVDKSSGEMALMPVEAVHMINATERIKNVKKFITTDKPPERCYPAEPDGTSGNMKLAVGCVFCPYKEDCWSDANGGVGLRKFEYSNGIRYLTTVAKVPNVAEVL